MTIIRCVAIAGLVVLASCGADGDPIRPFGSAGISVGTGGISTGAVVGATSGGVSVAVGL